jgi:hypothetical protein
VKTLIERLLKEDFESGDYTEERTYVIKASAGAFRALEKLLSAFEVCNCGMSRQLKFMIDGDGAARLEVLSPEKKDELTDVEAKALDNDELWIGAE